MKGNKDNFSESFSFYFNKKYFFVFTKNVSDARLVLCKGWQFEMF